MVFAVLRAGRIGETGAISRMFLVELITPAVEDVRRVVAETGAFEGNSSAR